MSFLTDNNKLICFTRRFKINYCIFVCEGHCKVIIFYNSRLCCEESRLMMLFLNGKYFRFKYLLNEKHSLVI